LLSGYLPVQVDLESVAIVRIGDAGDNKVIDSLKLLFDREGGDTRLKGIFSSSRKERLKLEVEKVGFPEVEWQEIGRENLRSLA
jgi:hypothetical protein